MMWLKNKVKKKKKPSNFKWAMTPAKEVSRVPTGDHLTGTGME